MLLESTGDRRAEWLQQGSRQPSVLARGGFCSYPLTRSWGWSCLRAPPLCVEVAIGGLFVGLTCVSLKHWVPECVCAELARMACSD